MLQGCNDARIANCCATKGWYCAKQNGKTAADEHRELRQREALLREQEEKLGLKNKQ